MSESAAASRPAYLLPVIVFAQFAGTSLWFAGNAIMPDLQAAYDLPPAALGHITAVVQLGFIIGTLVFAFLMVADRFSPSRVFMFCAGLAATCNLGVFFLAGGYVGVLLLRFGVGFCLAGIYPVGMKISSDWYAQGLGKALGYLVGALVLGTAFPHYLKFQASSFDWEAILVMTSAVAALGGLLIWLLVPDGPYRKRGSRFQPSVIARVFRYPRFRSAALGYFGHMWELYAFWAFVPVLLTAHRQESGATFGLSLWCFLVISMGTLGCIAGGYRSLRWGSGPVAFGMLLTSGLCCLLTPWAIHWPWPWFAAFLLVWGFAVVGDSPQFSTLVARTAPSDMVGSALTIVNSLGFALTIGSIQLLNWAAAEGWVAWMFWLLLPGPVLGLMATRRVLQD